MRKVILFMVVLCLFFPAMAQAKYSSTGKMEVYTGASNEYHWQGRVTSTETVLKLPATSDVVSIWNISAYKALYYELDGTDVSSGSLSDRPMPSPVLATDDYHDFRTVNFATSVIKMKAATGEVTDVDIYIIYDD